MASNSNEEADAKQDPPPQKYHTITVCMCPPVEATEVWNEMTRARTELKDPGLYRWPPHANLLYPFISLQSSKRKAADQAQESNPADDSDRVIDSAIFDELRNATIQCDPFDVTLDTFGTFGGNQRGVLWLYPKSSRSTCQQEEHTNEEPLVHLQMLLEREFPFCTDQRKQGRFSPHMTLSHFESLQDAKAAQVQVESWWQSQSFTCNEIYVLERKGDDGQFLRVASLGLGPVNSVQIHDPPEPFPAMPTVEEDWVKEERQKLKQRRNGKWKRRRRRGRSEPHTKRGPSKSTDTPKEIAAKRAARKAKRERLERESEERKETGEMKG